MEKYSFEQRVIKNRETGEDVVIHYLRRNEFPKFKAILHYHDRFKFSPNVMDDCSPEEQEKAFYETVDFLESSKEAKELVIKYEFDIVTKEITFF